MTSALPTWAHELGPARLLGGKYRLVRLLGVGGMGAVWAARNVATGAQVAIKVLLEQSGNAELVERMRREAYATASLSHRGIVRVYDLIDVGPAGGQSAMVMELLQGRTLAEYLHERGRLSEEEAVAIVLPVLSALEHAHGRGVTHRDLKPENVFLAVESDAVMTPKILDFGISKLRVRVAPNITHQGQLLGTPSYMSPEQVRGSAEVDERSDIFSMGILLYEMLSGRNPFAGDGQQPVLVAILEGHPAPLTDVTPALWNVIARALCKNPDDRFACAEELGAALRRARGWAAARVRVGLDFDAGAVVAAFGLHARAERARSEGGPPHRDGRRRVRWRRPRGGARRVDAEPEPRRSHFRDGAPPPRGASRGGAGAPRPHARARGGRPRRQRARGRDARRWPRADADGVFEVRAIGAARTTDPPSAGAGILTGLSSRARSVQRSPT